MSAKGAKRLSLKRKSSDNGNPSKKCETKKGFCPLCQMPLDIITCQTEAWHYEECFSVNRTGQKECPRGTTCDSTIVSHYLKETHLRLAALRCNLQSVSPESDAQDNPRIQPWSVAVGTEDAVLSTPEATVEPVTVVVDSSLHENPSIGTAEPSAVITKLDSDESRKEVQPEIPNRNGPRSQTIITSFFQHLGPKPRKPLKIMEPKKSASLGTATGMQKTPKTITVPEKPDFAFRNTASWHGEVSGRPVRPCPFYKKLVDVPFVVDAFSYGVIPGIVAYFLSHFHSDHYMGLNAKFVQPLFCSQVTANLVKMKLRVSESVIHPLPLDEPFILRGVEVTLIEANHCPGAVMFLFRYTDGRCVLHTGDFRADPAMEDHPAIASVHLDVLYLDTTYCKLNYDFPSQQEVLEFVVQIAKKHLKWHASTLIVCGAYTIGKEKVFLALADALQRQVWASREKLRIFQCLEDPALQAVLTPDQNLAGIHVLCMQQLNFKYLQEYMAKFGSCYSSLLAIKPTGWEHGSRKNVSNRLEGIGPATRGNIAIYGVPYSEHSSYGEMRHFVQSLRPARVIPTVNVAGHGAKQQMEVIRDWLK